jgi:DNA-binding SARP family transcriptional activator/tetratricopeptide (TPR) repeat protein
MTPTLRISLLGDVAIQLGDEVVAGLPSRAAEALLIYLVCNPRPVAREKLAELLWAERSAVQALTNLRTILTPLRRELGDYLVVTRQTLAFDHSRAHWLDVTEFEQGWAGLDLARLALPDAARAQQLQTVLDLYQGDFLEGFYLKGGQGFEEWATVERERLRHLARDGFRLLASFQLDAGEYRAGVATAARWRRLDPYSEEACRTHMWLLTRAGQPHLAAQAYQELRRTLQADLGVEPGASTASLFECVQGAHFPPPLDLPPAATAFIGREVEIDALARLLLARDSRLLTLAGPGGIGKTRLAIEAARALAKRLPGRFLNGVRFVPLAALKSAQSLPTHVASALGVELQGAAPPRQQLLSYLEARELLLILDNFEHLIDHQGEAVAFLVDLLRLAPNVKLLLTSRERLSLYEEVIFDVPGLDAPDEGEDEATMASAAQLFVEAGRRVRRNYAPGAGELRWIARACRLVEGTPLAIELAASWLRHYDCAEIVRQIEQSLDFLASNYRDLPERQRSLRSVFEYSWQLLTPDEQAALAQLSVFTGGVAPDAADAVLGLRAPLADLADKSLLQRLPAGRFDLHPLLRVYAAEKLALDPQLQLRTTNEHAGFYLDYLAAQGSGESPEQRAAIRLDLANMRCAWEWAARCGMWEALGHAAATLHSFYSIQSWFQEGIDLFAQTLAMLEADGARLAPAALHAELLGRKARMHIHIGGLVQARADLRQALAGLGQIEDPVRRRSVLDSLAITHYYAGDYSQAAALAQDSLRLSEQSGNQDGIGFALNFLGSCAKAQGDYEQARAFFQRAAETALLLQDEIGAAMVYNNLGNLLQSMGDWSGAQRYYQQSSELFGSHDHVHGAATTLANAGKLAYRRGAYDEARQLLRESLTLKRKIGDPRGEAVALAGLGDVALATGAHAEARVTLLQALELAHQAGDLKLTLETLASFAELLHRQGQRAAAVRLLDFTLNHRGVSQEARQRAEQLAREIDYDWAAAPAAISEARFKDESGMFSFLQSLG